MSLAVLVLLIVLVVGPVVIVGALSLGVWFIDRRTRNRRPGFIDLTRRP